MTLCTIVIILAYRKRCEMVCRINTDEYELAGHALPWSAYEHGFGVQVKAAWRLSYRCENAPPTAPVCVHYLCKVEGGDLGQFQIIVEKRVRR